MTEVQYHELCQACDRLLLAQDSTHERIAIPWLHVIREHPVFLETYHGLFLTGWSFSSIIRSWALFLRSKAGWLKQLALALQSDGSYWSCSQKLPRRVDVLFVSHLLNEDQVDQELDFYFGGIPLDLAVKGYSVAIVLLNHTGLPATTFRDKWRATVVPRILLQNSLGLADEVQLLRRLSRESVRLKSIAKIAAPGFAKSILSRAAFEATSSSSRLVLRTGRQIETLVDLMKPTIVVTTYEGHSWERITFAAARSVHPPVMCVGYQHAAVFRLQHAIRRNLAAEYNPDRIMTVGSIAQSQLSRAPGLKSIPVTVLGTNRSFHARRGADDDDSKKNRSACLVLPEGFDSECQILFKFALECAEALPDITFIFRLHPLTTYESLASRNPELWRAPRNMVISSNALADDIGVSRWSLYRGSTAIVTAVGGGVRPVYLRRRGEMNIDPLYELGEWRANIASLEDFLKLIRNDLAQEPSELISSSKFLAEEYCATYFVPPRFHVLPDLLTQSHGFSPPINYAIRESLDWQDE